MNWVLDKVADFAVWLGFITDEDAFNWAAGRAYEAKLKNIYKNRK